MDKVKFFEEQYMNLTTIHKANKEYECLDEDETHYYIRQEYSPKGKNWCSKIPKTMEGKLFEFVK
jgi:hypothetical protein